MTQTLLALSHIQEYSYELNILIRQLTCQFQLSDGMYQTMDANFRRTVKL